MFLDSGKAIAGRIQSLIDAEVTEPVRLAVAFWGAGADYRLRGPCRIVCDLDSGACNPAIIRTLRMRDNCVVLKLSDFHAKVVIGSGGAVVSSANMSTNGLGAEGADVSGTIEAGYFVEAKLPDYKKIVGWFEDIWQQASVITELELAIAQERWNSRPRGLLDAPSADAPLDIAAFGIDPFSLLEEHIDADDRLRAVKSDVFNRLKVELTDDHRRLGMIATWACHLLLNRAGIMLEHSAGNGEERGPATDEWIVGRFGKQKKAETAAKVAVLLNAICRSSYFSADVRRAAGLVLSARPWIESSP